MKLINNLLILLIWVINIGAIILNLTIGYDVNILVCIALSIIIIIPRIFKKRLGVTDTIEFIYLIFILLAGVLGSVIKLYATVYWYDSFTHFLSGVLTAYLALIILARTKKYDKKNFFNVFFIILFALAVAAFWEIFEFTSDSLLGYDAQKVIETGVTDTMKDIICALLGSILFIITYLYKKDNLNIDKL